MVEPCGLFKHVYRIASAPIFKSIQHVLPQDVNLMNGNAEVELNRPFSSGPGPNVSKHLWMKLIYPIERKWRLTLRRLRREINDNRLANVFRLKIIELASGCNVSKNQPGNVIDRRFARDVLPFVHRSEVTPTIFAVNL